MSTVKSTENRIFNFSVMESLLMISMAGLQVFIVRFFFQGARKGKFHQSCATIEHTKRLYQDMYDRIPSLPILY